MPCAIISRATTRRQQTHRTTVGELLHARELPAPTLLVVGEVVRFANCASLAGEFFVPTEVETATPAMRAALADSSYQIIDRVETDLRQEESLA
jgi:siroheme synthase